MTTRTFNTITAFQITREDARVGDFVTWLADNPEDGTLYEILSVPAGTVRFWGRRGPDDDVLIRDWDYDGGQTFWRRATEGLTDEAKIIADLTAMTFALEEDLKIIDSKLRAVARDRGFCSEYEEFVDDVNAATSKPHLSKRTRRYKVEMTLTQSIDSFEDSLQNGMERTLRAAGYNPEDLIVREDS